MGCSVGMQDAIQKTQDAAWGCGILYKDAGCHTGMQDAV